MKKRNMIELGVIADDFTGASDAASFLVKNGWKTVLYTHIPDAIIEDCDCIVIALKTRSIEPKEAVNQTKKVVESFETWGVKKIYFKYCSTFDSTPKGNIGCVMDFMLDRLQLQYTVLCPSLPVNGRTVKDGVLYVNAVPLSESPMKNHPLNPMWDSSIPNLMKAQSKYPSIIVSRDTLEDPGFHDALAEYMTRNEKFYVVPDFENEADGGRIARTFGHLPFLSGGSGLLSYLSRPRSEKFVRQDREESRGDKGIILCGSCSKMTKKQIQWYRQYGGLTYVVDSRDLREYEASLQKAIAFITENAHKTVLVYSDAVEKDMSILSLNPFFAEDSKQIEKLMADLSEYALKNQFDKIIVAGGETSGAVTQRLGFGAYNVGEEISPGVPILYPLEKSGLMLVLKSGNFGSEDFFIRASKGESIDAA